MNTNTDTDNTPIDFVLPWVDGSDPVWQAEKNHYLPQHYGRNDATSNNRYHDFGTLRYVLRSIEQNCPWYHKIYLITANQRPHWLQTNHPKIEIIDHTQLFIQPQNLPVFNSSAIEMNLVNLKGLSEHFVYLNDDTVILRPTPRERLFQHGLPVDFLCHGWLKRNALFRRLRGQSSWVDALNNNIALINRVHKPHALNTQQLFAPSYSLREKLSNALLKYLYRHYFWFAHWHLPQPYTRSTLQQVYQHFQPEILACTANRFRAHNDLTIYLNRYWHLASGAFIPHKHNDGFTRNINNLTELNHTIEYLHQHPEIRFVCLNDSYTGNNSAELAQLNATQSAFYEHYLPNPASFEQNSSQPPQPQHT
jgi:hypothetical protein